MKAIVFQVIILVTSTITLFGQQNYIKALEGNVEYMTLIKSQQQMKQTLDSIQNQISISRKAFGTANNNEANKESIAKQIVHLEGELYEIRNNLGRSTAKTAAIEQDFVIKNMGTQSTNATNTPIKGSKSIFSSQFFKNNLSPTDINRFNSEPAKVDPQVREITSKIDKIYNELGELKVRYSASDDQDQIDSLSKVAGRLKEQIEDADAQLEKTWISLYNQKLDAYLILIDKLGNIDRVKLEQLDAENRAVRRAEGLASEQLAPLVATYPLQKRMALDYEIAIAEKLELKAAKDSLELELKRIPSQTPTYPDIIFEPRNLIVYSQITKSAEQPYATSADVPQLKIPKRGVYYTIQLSAMSAPATNMGIFKGMMPLMQEKLSDGRIRYAAGGFRTYAQAQVALSQMVKAGFRAPVIAAWINGVQTTPTKAKAAEPVAAVNSESSTGTGIYTVDIQPSEGRLSVALREVITSSAPDKTILRTTVNGKVVYSVGNFRNHNEAQSLLDTLLAKENVKATITEQQ